MTYLWLLLQLIIATTHGHLVTGPTYAAAEWNCGLEYRCYFVASWAGDGLLTAYEVGP